MRGSGTEGIEASEEGAGGEADGGEVLLADALGAGAVEFAEEIVGGVLGGPGAEGVGVGAVRGLRVRGRDRGGRACGRGEGQPGRR